MRLSGVMLRLAATFALLASGCSPTSTSVSQQEPERVRLSLREQDPRCRDTVESGLAPGSFDYGVVSSAATAKRTAEGYFRAMFSRSDVPVDEVLRQPMAAELRRGVWNVATTVPKEAVGVHFLVKICQSNGRVLELTGGQ